MKVTRKQLISVLMAAASLFVTIPLRLVAQEDVLKLSGPDVQALRSLREPLQMFGLNPFDNPITQATSPDSQALQMLNEAASSGASELGAMIDLLAVYDNLQCAPDRATLKPLLVDRLHLNSRLLGLGAQKAALPLGPPSIITLQTTSKKALKLHDDLLAAKTKLDTIASSLE